MKTVLTSITLVFVIFLAASMIFTVSEGLQEDNEGKLTLNLNSTNSMEYTALIGKTQEIKVNSNDKINLSQCNFMMNLKADDSNSTRVSENGKFLWTPKERGVYNLNVTLTSCDSQASGFKQIEVIDQSTLENLNNTDNIESSISKIETQLETVKNVVSSPSRFDYMNLVLLIFTALLSVKSITFQKQTSVRESLDQLNEVICGNWKMNAILHSFNTRFGIFGNSEIDIKVYQIHHEKVANAGRPEAAQDYIESRFELEEFEEIEGVDRAKFSDGSLRIFCNSINAIQCRNVAERTMKKIQREVVS